RRAYDRHEGQGPRWLMQLALMVVIAAGLWGVAFIASQFHGKTMFPSWWQVFGFCLVIGFLGAIALPLLNLLTAYNVRSWESGIELKRINIPAIETILLRWEDVRELEIDEQAELDSQLYRVLRIRTAGNAETLVGIPERVSNEEIEEAAS